MTAQTDNQLLQAYAVRKSEPAFAELVRRHVDFVYSAAARLIRDPHLAQDVTQGVFVALAENASQLADRPVLSGWLHRTTQNIAAQTVRTIERRRARELEAAAMNDLLSAAPDASWEEIQPHLDAALGELSETERDAILLRYFEKKSATEIATRLGVSAEAAQKRLSRAVERLREFFAKRGVTVGTSGLGLIISAKAVQAAPAGLAVTISSAALGGTVATVPAIIAATTKTIAMTTLQKTAIAATVAALAGAGFYEAHRISQMSQQVESLQQQLTPLVGQVQLLEHERDEAVMQIAALVSENERLNQEAGEMLILVTELGGLRRNAVAANQSVSTPGQQATESVKGAKSPDDLGRELGLAAVRGEPNALRDISALAKSGLQSFHAQSAGLNETRRGELAALTFSPVRSAFSVIEGAALQGNQVAADAIIGALQFPELKGHAVQSIGALAGNGNNDALAILLDYEHHGFLLSTTVGALQPAAEQGNQQAIEVLSAVTRDEKHKALWYMAASGLAKAAESGNASAVEALVGISGSACAMLSFVACVEQPPIKAEPPPKPCVQWEFNRSAFAAMSRRKCAPSNWIHSTAA